MDDFDLDDKDSIQDNKSDVGDIGDIMDIFNEDSSDIPHTSEVLLTDNLVALPRMVNKIKKKFVFLFAYLLFKSLIFQKIK